MDEKEIEMQKPKSGFVEVTKHIAQGYVAHDVARDSAALTYYLLFAIFPLTIFVSTMLGIMELDVDMVIRVIQNVVPGDVTDIVEDYLEYVTNNSSSVLLWFSLVFSIWFPMRATNCLMHSVRKAFRRSAPGNMMTSWLLIFIFTIVLIMMLGGAFALIMLGRRALSFISRFIVISDAFIHLWSYLRFIIIGVMMVVALSLLYMMAQGERRPMREVLPGVVVSLIAWMLLSLAFSYYVEHFARYTQLYGSIAAIVVVLLWLYMSGMVIILGAELSGALTYYRKRKEAYAAFLKSKEEIQ